MNNFLDTSARVVLVTNVGQGFGRAIALSFGQMGYDVVCADKDVDLASKTAAEIEELGGQAIPIQADMSLGMDVQHAFDKVFEIFGDLTGIIHVASYASHTALRELTEAEFSELLNENVRSTFLTLKTTARMLESAWLVLVSPPKNATEPHMLGIRGAITRMAAAFESRYANLRVNVVIPSRAASDPKHDAHLVKSVHYLGSEDAEGVSGHRLYIELPPPPKLTETLLPEVRAALDETVRQDDLEADAIYEDYDADEDESLEDRASNLNDVDLEGLDELDLLDEDLEHFSDDRI